MVTVPIAFLLSLLIALALTPLVRRFAIHLGALDNGGASSRKIHAGSMPRLGGLAIVAAFYAPLVALFIVNTEVGRLFRADTAKALGLLLGGVPIVALGVYDDLRGANAPKKFLVQFGVAIALVALGFRISVLSTPFGSAINLGWFGYAVSVLWIVGVINAMNLIDGLDGLASGIAFFAAATTLVIAFVNHNILMMLFMATLSGATLAFLAYNFNPASIFMGDTGSMFLGYVIAVTAVQTNTKGPATVALVVPVLALGLPIMDTTLAMVRRFLRGQSMFQADRGHIHHRLVAMGFSHRAAVLVLYGMSLMLGAAAVAVTVLHGPQTAAILAGTIVVVALFMRRLGYLNVSSFAAQAQAVVRQRRYNLEVRRAARALGSRLRSVRSFDDLWEALVGVAEPLHLAKLELVVPMFGPSGGERRAYQWEAQGDTRQEQFVAACELDCRSATGASLRFAWADGRKALDRDDEIAVEVISDHVTAGIDRLVRAGGLAVAHLRSV